MKGLVRKLSTLILLVTVYLRDSTVALGVGTIVDSACYDHHQLEKIADGLKDLKTCRATLKLREEFIESAQLAPPPEHPWWQEPQFIVGGVVVSFGTGLILGALALGAR